MSAADWTTGAEAILYGRCARCGTVWYFARDFCPSCGCSDVRAEASAGRGAVFASTEVVRAPSPELRPFAPYTILLVDLDEGFRMMAHGDPGLAIGERVEVGFARVAGRLVPRFRRAAAGPFLSPEGRGEIRRRRRAPPRGGRA